MWNTFNYKTKQFEKDSIEEDIDYKNAVAYLRVSSSRQESKWHWIDSQRSACIEAEKLEWHNLKNIFEDKAISWKVIDREWLINCLAYIKECNSKPWEDNIKYLYCTEISRLTRPEYMDEWLTIIRQFREEWVIVYDVFNRDYYSRWDDIKIIQLMFKIYWAKTERENWANRSKNWVLQRLKAGYRAFSNPPIWYKFEHRSINGKKNAYAILDQPNASIIAEALRLYGDWTLYNATEFLEHLRENKLTTNSRTTPWEKIYKSLFPLIMKPERLFFYSGQIVYLKWWITEPVEWKHEAIITRETLDNIFNRLDKAHEKRPYKTKSNNKEKFPLRRLIKCWECHKTMYWTFAKKEYPYYECKNKECGLREKWISRSCDANEIHDEAKELITKCTIWKNVEKLITYMSENILVERLNITDKKILNNKKHIKSLEKEMRQIESKIVTVSEWLSKQLQSRREECEQKIISITKEIEDLELSKDSYELNIEVLKIFENPVTIWNNYDTDAKQLLIKVLFDWKLYKQKNRTLRTPAFSLPMRLFDDIDILNEEWYTQMDSNHQPTA